MNLSLFVSQMLFVHIHQRCYITCKRQNKQLTFLCMFVYFSWVSVLQNSKEEALNTALGGDQLHLQDSGLQELSRAIIAELRHMPGNEACADCGAPGLAVICNSQYRMN